MNIKIRYNTELSSVLIHLRVLLQTRSDRAYTQGIFMKRKRNVLNSTFFTRTWYTDCKQTTPFFGIRVDSPHLIAIIL